MFSKIEIALVSDGIALSAEGEEYEVVPAGTADCLVLDQLLNQLKLSNIKYGYYLEGQKVVYLRKAYANLELLDDSIRFEFNSKKVINLKDIYLFNKISSLSISSNTSPVLYLKWGKKNEYFFDLRVDENSDRLQLHMAVEKVRNDIDQLMLDQRFSVLLNKTFLDKLKTYLALWKQTNNVAYTLPNWYQNLYFNQQTSL